MEQRRYAGLDALRAAAALMVVCVHCLLPGQWGRYIEAVSRSAVPVFFLITGFFYADSAGRGGAIRQMKKIALLLAKAMLFYLIWQSLREWALGHSVWGYLRWLFSLERISRFILWNEPSMASHLWYLSALLYALAIVAVTESLGKRRALCVLSLVFLLTNDATVIFMKEIPLLWVRNFLLTALPYLCLGMLLRDWTEGRRIRSGWCAAAAVIGMGLTVLEWNLLKGAGYAPVREHYISSTVTAAALVLWAYCQNEPGKIQRAVAKFGRECSVGIYILHPAIMVLLQDLGLAQAMPHIAPFLIYALAALPSALGIRFFHTKKQS